MAVPKSKEEPFLFLEKNKFLFSRHLRAMFLFPKILSFKKPAHRRQRQLFKFLRLAQKKPLHTYKKIEAEQRGAESFANLLEG